MIDLEVEKLTQIIMEELESQGTDSECLWFRREDCFVDGRLDVASLATVIIEKFMGVVA